MSASINQSINQSINAMIEQHGHTHCRKCGNKLTKKANRKKGFCDKCIITPLPGQLMFTFDAPAKQSNKPRSKRKGKGTNK